MFRRTLGVCCFIASLVISNSLQAASLPVKDVITPITGDTIDLEVFPKPKKESYTGKALLIESVSFSPGKLKNSPARICRSISATATVSPNRFDRLDSLTSLAM